MTLTFVLFIAAFLSLVTLYSFDADGALQHFLSSSEKYYSGYFDAVSQREVAKLDALLK